VAVGLVGNGVGRDIREGGRIGEEAEGVVLSPDGDGVGGRCGAGFVGAADVVEWNEGVEGTGDHGSVTAKEVTRELVDGGEARDVGPRGTVGAGGGGVGGWVGVEGVVNVGDIVDVPLDLAVADLLWMVGVK